MRGLCLAVAGLATASCTTAPPATGRTEQSQQMLERLIAGKIAKPPIKCLASYNAGDMTVIDEHTIAFRRSANQVFIAHMQDDCDNLGRPGYALLTSRYGSEQCQGDIAEVIETSVGIIAGSCAFGEFTPYVKPGR